MNWTGISAIARKDMMVVRRSKAVMIPLVLVPLLLLVVAPFFIVLAAQSSQAASATISDLDHFISQMPTSMREHIDSLANDSQRMIVIVTLYFMAPLYLIVPLMVAAVIAADSFAGEKERKTLEALLYSPTTDRELLLGKLLAAWVPAVTIGVAGFIGYGIVINLAGWPVMESIFFPTFTWVLLAFWVGPGVAGTALGVMVIISSRVGTFQEAYQLGGVVVVPLILLVVGQAAGIIYFSPWVAGVIGLIIWSINTVLLIVAIRRFRRERILLTGL